MKYKKIYWFIWTKIRKQKVLQCRSLV